MVTPDQLDRIQKFADIAKERQLIYARKERGYPKPWTEDKVFGNWFFCNVFREQDKTSVWLKKNIIDAYAHDPDNWKRIIIARYYSRLDAAMDIQAHETWESVASIREGVVRRLRAHLPIHTSGFLVAPGDAATGRFKFDLPFLLVKELEAANFTNAVTTLGSLEAVWKTLLPFYGVGSFMGYQFVCDFAYDRQYLLNACDHDTWTAPGPGSLRGMNRILTGSPSERNTEASWLESARVLLSLWRAVVADDPDYKEGELKRFQNLHLCNVQHWLCEYDKYERGGSAKRRYNAL